MKILTFFLGFLLLSNVAFGAIKFDFMDETLGLSKEQRLRLVEKLRLVDLEEIKSGAQKVKEHLPEGVVEGTEELLDESGIDAGGVFSAIFGIFKEIGSWALGLFSELGGE